MRWSRGGSPRPSAPRGADVDATDLCFTSAVELAELIRRRALSPVEVVRAVLERIERLNTRLGAYVMVHAERALGERSESKWWPVRRRT